MEDNSRNIILMVVLTLAIFIGYDYLYLRPQKEQAQRLFEAEQVQLRESQKTDPALSPTTNPDTTGFTQQTSTATDDDLGLQYAGSIEIDTPELAGALSLRGARIEALTLKNHKITLKGDEPVTLLVPYGEERAYYARFGWASSTSAGGYVPDETTAWETNDTRLTPDSPVTLTWTNSAGIKYSMVVAVDEQFLFTVTQSVENTSGEQLSFAPYGLISRQNIPKSDALYILHEGPFGVFNDTFEEYDYDDFEDDPVIETPSKGGWLGLTDKYWMTALIPDASADLSRARLSRKGSISNPTYQASFVENWHEVAPGTRLERTSRLYAGAKEVEVIDTYAEQYNIALFDRTIDWGYFYFLTRPIFFLLDLFHGIVGNFGVAIILLVIALKIVLFPLANRQYSSMAHMKEAQPKIKALQERYKNDRAAMQQEMMKLYKKEKINPLAGCLPLVPQIFIFFALYKVLYVTIDMRHEPFIAWIKDLSAADPLTPFNLFGLIPWDPPGFIAIGVLPILMGLTMVIQQRLNPSAMEPAQQKIMNLMPIVFTFIMANFSAGLVLYWTVNSGLSVLQQWVITRRIANKSSSDSTSKS